MQRPVFPSVLLVATLTAGSIFLGHALIGQAASPSPPPMASTPPQEYWTKVNQTEDAAHTPLINAPAKVKAGEMFAVEVQIGKGKLHPTLPDHHVLWVTLFVDETPVAHVSLAPTIISPKFTFHLTLQKSAMLRVREMPNHSAPWESSARVEVN